MGKFKITHGYLKKFGHIHEELQYRTFAPVHEVKAFDNPLYGETEYPVCPRCKHTMEREYMAFCDRCGQKLSWDNFENAIVLHN